ncbi:MAG: DHHW family protein [Lachnospiraceae bacterium]
MSNETKQGKIKIYKYISILFLIVLIGITLLNVVKKDRKYSENENRMLTVKPRFTLSRVISGRYMKQYEAYKADQFAGRDFWVQLKTKVDKFSGKKEENGVFQGKDNYLMEDIVPAASETVNENLEAMKSFQQTYHSIPMHMLLVPDAANILSEKMPAFAVTADQKNQIKQVKKKLGNGFIWNDAVKPLEKNKEKEIYYHTDHHWTTKGAYEVFQTMTKSLGIEKNRIVKMKPYAVSDSFNGTLSATSGFEMKYKEPIYIYLPQEEETEVLVNYVEEQKKTVSMYDSSKLDEKDQYGMFLSGNHPLVSLKTISPSGERMLIIKDSYANCFIPFLTPYYREIMVVDPRYYYGNIHKLMKEHKFDRVLFLYNANTFFQDNNLSGMLSYE